MERKEVPPKKRLPSKLVRFGWSARTVATVHYSPDKQAQSDDGLARPAAVSAKVRSVEGGLGGESRQPEDAEEAIYGNHGMWLGSFARSGEARCADEVDPCWY
jgi:hypothetical protein